MPVHWNTLHVTCTSSLYKRLAEPYNIIEQPMYPLNLLAPAFIYICSHLYRHNSFCATAYPSLSLLFDRLHFQKCHDTAYSFESLPHKGCKLVKTSCCFIPKLGLPSVIQLSGELDSLLRVSCWIWLDAKMPWNLVNMVLFYAFLGMRQCASEIEDSAIWCNL